MRILILLLIVNLWTGMGGVRADVTVPVGFRLTVFAHVPDARTLVAVPQLGAIFVGTRSSSIYAIVDQNRDGVAESVRRLTSSLKVPNGLAWKNGYLYVAEQHRLVRFFIGDSLPDQLGAAEVLFDALPDRRWHGWRYAAFGPDGGLYVSIGAPCNICELRGLEGTIVRFEPGTWVPVIFAHGVRNSVGLAFDPLKGDLVFTDNGADDMGDDSPPDELNRAPVGGLHFGYPYFGGGRDRTQEFLDKDIPVNRPPVHGFQAHVAPLGVEFYKGERFPERYREGVFVALHGSWNRSEPVGYRVAFLPMDPQGRVLGEENIVSGWLSPQGEVTGRPVDLEEWADGRLLISDDSEGLVYILDYHE